MNRIHVCSSVRHRVEWIDIEGCRVGDITYIDIDIESVCIDSVKGEGKFEKVLNQANNVKRGQVLFMISYHIFISVSFYLTILQF